MKTTSTRSKDGPRSLDDSRGPADPAKSLQRRLRPAGLMVAVLSASVACAGGGTGDGSGAERTGSASAAIVGGTPPSHLPPPPQPVVAASSPIVGYLPESFAVTSTGQFTYDLPLDVPDGVAGMKPRLSLHFSSDAGNGSLGRGWSVSGSASVILLCNKTIASDGHTDGPMFAGNDDYCLDGMKLVPVPGTSPQAFSTEQDTVARITLQANNTFTVQRSNGRTQTYNPVTTARLGPSGTSTGNVTSTWLLSQETDPAGNSLAYSYVTSLPNEIHVSAINYLPYGTPSPLRSVRFVYVPRPDRDVAYYSAGLTINATQQLSQIQMWAPDPVAVAEVWSYQLTYETGELGRSLLTSVIKVGSLGSQTYSRTFGWYESFTSASMASGSPQTLATSVFGSGAPSALDVNGDGMTDLVWHTSSDGVYVSLSTGSGFSTPTLAAPTVASAYECAAPAAPVLFNLTGSAPGSGLLEPVPTGSASTCYAWQPMQWSSQSAAYVAVGSALPSIGTGSYVPGDLNGDGRDDLMGGGSLWLNSGNGVFTTAVSSGIGVLAPTVLPLYGDGKMEVVGCTSSACTRAEIQSYDPGADAASVATLTLPSYLNDVFADLNGDGLKDAVSALSATPTVIWNTGNGFAASFTTLTFAGELVTASTRTGVSLPVIVIDLNRDGRDDLVFRYAVASGYAYDVQLSNGDGTFYDGGAYGLPGSTTSAPAILVTGDFDGDGKLDLANVAYGSISTTVTPYYAYSVPDVDLLTEVGEAAGPTESLSSRLGIAYGRTSAATSSSLSCVYPTLCIRQGLPVVTELYGPEVGTPVYYAFEGPTADLNGRGFLGYATEREWQPARPWERTTTFDNLTRQTLSIGGGTHAIYPYAGRAKTVTDATPIVTQSAPWFAGAADPTTSPTRYVQTQVSNLPQNTSSAYMVLPYQVTTSSWEATSTPNWTSAAGVHVPVVSAAASTSSSTTFHWDAYGNITQYNRVETGPSTSVMTNVGLTYVPADTTLWRVNLLASRQAQQYTAPGAAPPYSTTTYTYTSAGQLWTTTYEPQCGVGTSPCSQVSNIADVNEVLSNSYDGNGRLISTVATTPDESLPRAQYYAYNDISNEGVYLSSTYSALGAAVSSTSFWYHPALGVIEEVTDPNGIPTSYAHDDLGRLVTTWLPAGDVETTTTTPVLSYGFINGIQVTVARASGSQATSISDGLGRVVTTGVLGFGGQWSYQATTYDVFGRKSALSNPGFSAPSTWGTSTEYDSLDRPVLVTQPDSTTLQYAQTFFTTTTTGPLGTPNTSGDEYVSPSRQTVVTYDQLRRVVSTQQMGGTANPGTFTTYGQDNLPATINEPGGYAEVLTYDVRDRKTGIVDPDRGAVTNLFNGYNEQRGTTDSLGTTMVAHDAAGRVTSISAPQGSSLYEYDISGGSCGAGLGRLCFTQSPDGVAEYTTYNSVGLVSQELTQVWGPYPLKTVSYGYDSYGRVQQVSYPTSGSRPDFVVATEYNGRGYVSAIQRNATSGGSVLLPVWTPNAYNAAGAVASATFGNGVTDTRTYDPTTLHPLTEELCTSASVTTANPTSCTPGGTALASITYWYWTDGRFAQASDTANWHTDAYGYDGLGRLSWWNLYWTSSQQTQYTYADNGNLTGTVLCNAEGCATGDTNGYGVFQGRGEVLALPHAITSHDGTGYGYDARGRQTSSGAGLLIQYNDFDLPMSITKPSGTTTFLYDALHRRTLKSPPSGKATLTVGGGLYEERFGQAPSGGNLHVFKIGNVAQVAFDDGVPLSPAAEWTEYFHIDTNESLNLVTSDAGTVMSDDGGVHALDYHEPFGVRFGASTGAALPAGSYTSDVHGLFAGHDYDDDLGYIDMKGRIYDPTLRRFLTPDPLVSDPRNAQSYNRYSYVSNDPLSYTDPTGFQPATYCGGPRSCTGHGGGTEDDAAFSTPAGPPAGGFSYTGDGNLTYDGSYLPDAAQSMATYQAAGEAAIGYAQSSAGIPGYDGGQSVATPETSSRGLEVSGSPAQPSPSQSGQSQPPPADPAFLQMLASYAFASSSTATGMTDEEERAFLAQLYVTEGLAQNYNGGLIFVGVGGQITAPDTFVFNAHGLPFDPDNFYLTPNEPISVEAAAGLILDAGYTGGGLLLATCYGSGQAQQLANYLGGALGSGANVTVWAAPTSITFYATSNPTFTVTGTDAPATFSPYVPR